MHEQRQGYVCMPCTKCRRITEGPSLLHETHFYLSQASGHNCQRNQLTLVRARRPLTPGPSDLPRAQSCRGPDGNSRPLKKVALAATPTPAALQSDRSSQLRDSLRVCQPCMSPARPSPATLQPNSCSTPAPEQGIIARAPAAPLQALQSVFTSPPSTQRAGQQQPPAASPVVPQGAARDATPERASGCSPATLQGTAGHCEGATPERGRSHAPLPPATPPQKSAQRATDPRLAVRSSAARTLFAFPPPEDPRVRVRTSGTATVKQEACPTKTCSLAHTSVKDDAGAKDAWVAEASRLPVHIKVKDEPHESVHAVAQRSDTDSRPHIVLAEQPTSRAVSRARHALSVRVRVQRAEPGSTGADSYAARPASDGSATATPPLPEQPGLGVAGAAGQPCAGLLAEEAAPRAAAPITPSAAVHTQPTAHHCSVSHLQLTAGLATPSDVPPANRTRRTAPAQLSTDAPAAVTGDADPAAGTHQPVHGAPAADTQPCTASTEQRVRDTAAAAARAAVARSRRSTPGNCAADERHHSTSTRTMPSEAEATASDATHAHTPQPAHSGCQPARPETASPADRPAPRAACHPACHPAAPHSQQPDGTEAASPPPTVRATESGPHSPAVAADRIIPSHPQQPGMTDSQPSATPAQHAAAANAGYVAPDRAPQQQLVPGSSVDSPQHHAAATQYPSPQHAAAPLTPPPHPSETAAPAADECSNGAGPDASGGATTDCVDAVMLLELRETIRRATAMEQERDRWQTPDDADIAAVFVQQSDRLQSTLRGFQAAAVRVRYSGCIARSSCLDFSLLCCRC